MSVPVKAGATLVFVGDSITAQGWFSATGGLVDQVNAQITPRPYAGTVAGGGSVGSVAGGGRVASVVSVAVAVTTVNSGVPGNQTSDIAAAVPARITNYTPSAVVLLIGVNDVTNAVSEATIRANYDSILSQIRAWSSTVPIACVSVLWYGEQWAAGPAWSNSPSFDAAIDVCNADIQTLCATYGCTYISMRPLALTYESLHNTPAPGVRTGVLSLDGLHPNATGQLQMGGWAIGSFAVT